MVVWEGAEEQKKRYGEGVEIIGCEGTEKDKKGMKEKSTKANIDN